MANILKCKRCGGDVPPRACAPHKRFCSTDCYETWWNEARSKRVTRSEVAEKILGAAHSVRLTETQAAWVAGLIDGEGTVGIWRERREGNRSGFRYRAGVQVANTNLELLQVFAQAAGGAVRIGDIRRNSPLHKPCFKVTVNARAVRPLLEQVAPFLIVKKRQADIVIQFRRLLEGAPMRTYPEHESFDAMWAECMALNKRGR